MIQLQFKDLPFLRCLDGWVGKAVRILIQCCSEFKSHWRQFYFLKPSVSILYRNVRFVLKTKKMTVQIIRRKKILLKWSFLLTGFSVGRTITNPDGRSSIMKWTQAPPWCAQTCKLRKNTTGNSLLFFLILIKLDEFNEMKFSKTLQTVWDWT